MSIRNIFSLATALLLTSLSCAVAQQPATTPQDVSDPKSSIVLPGQTPPVKPAIALPKGDLSVPQLLLFVSNQLGNIGRLSTLSYSFRHSGTLDAPFDDNVTMQITALNPDGTRDVSFKFLSGEHAQNFPPMDHFGGNPLIMLFMERDTGEMHRLTGGAELFFRDRIRAAYAEPGAVLESVQVPYDGHSIDAIRVTIAPYTAPKYKDHLKKFSGKQYSIILSGVVPGGLYQITAITPNPDGSKPLAQDELTYKDQTQAAETQKADAP
jgi:hypothetical protein